MNQHPPIYQAMVAALVLLHRAERTAVIAADTDLDAMLLVAAVQSSSTRLMLVSPTLERDAAAHDSSHEQVPTAAESYFAVCNDLLADAADRLDTARATTTSVPHGLLPARAALSEALRECLALGRAS
jgi:hypothetical protein